MLKTETVVTRIDDIDGSTGDGVKTRRITLDIELELTDANYQLIKDQLDEWKRKASRPAAKRGTGRGRVAKARVAADGAPR